MRKVVKKLFWVWQFEEEERWLNKMAAQGLALVSVGFCRYEFEPCRPGEYAVRLELLENLPNHPESEQYIRFMEETGAQQIGSYLRWVYFRKKTDQGPFDLFSDLDSRIAHLKRIIWLVIPLILLNIGTVVYNLCVYAAYREPISLVSLINAGIVLWLCWGLRKLRNRKKRLEADKQIFE